MSPEQIRSARTVDSRADIWSLGIVLHELVSANHPFPADTPWDTLAQILSRPPIPLRAQRADAPAALEAVVQRCLEKERDQRFADVASLVAALSAIAKARAQGRAERALGTPDPGLGARAVSESTASSLSPPSGSTLSDANWGATSTRHPWTRRRLLAGAGVLAVAGVAAAIIALSPDGPKEDRAAAPAVHSETAAPAAPPEGETPAPPPAPEPAAAPSAPPPVVSPSGATTAQPAQAPVVTSAGPAPKPAPAVSARKRGPALAAPPSSAATKPKPKTRSAEDILNQRVYAPAKK
jgi:serine/threonine-protein kinase